MTTATATSRRQRSRALGLCTAAALLVAAPRAFVPASTQAEAQEVGRRVLVGSVAPAVFGLAAERAYAIPRVTDIDLFINTRKLELVPVFKQGMDYLAKSGCDDRMIAFLPRMVRKMKVYASIFSMDEAPDATVRRLEKDTEAFRKAVEVAKDKDAALEAFEQYRLHIPGGVGQFDLKNPKTYEAPPPEDPEGAYDN